MKFIVAKKVEMTQKYKDDGTVVPVTLLQADPCVVTQVKTAEKDGYDAVQVGCDEIKKVSKPQEGHLKAVGKKFRTTKEFRTAADAGFKVGDLIEVSQFEAGDSVDVTGVSKGKGFQGVVKRHGFKGSPASHGHKDQLRMPGSIGDTGVQRVFKGTRMAGRMGNAQITVKNLEVVEVDGKNGVLAIKGAVPGARGTLLIIQGGQEGRNFWS